MKKVTQAHPAHVELATAAICVMALTLAVVLDLTGLAQPMNAALGAVFLPEGMKAPENNLDPLVLWLATAFLSLALPAVILNINEMWRRLLIWSLTFAVTLLWGPVLLLSAFQPAIAVPLAAVLWSGFCAVFYASTHTMPADIAAQKQTTKNDGPR